MAGYAAAAAVALALVQAILLLFDENLGFGAYLCPGSASIDTVMSIPSYTYIVVGSGEAGSIVAYRLSEKFPGATILVLEQGGCPPLESLMPGYFTMLPRSTYDGAYDIYNDTYSGQALQSTDGATIGKMLGGCGSINHMIYVTPTPEDYNYWAEAAGDSSWAFPDFAKYFARGETVVDDAVLAQNTSYHGTSGPTLLKRQQSSTMTDIINAHVEIGIEHKDDVDGLCIVEPLLAIGDGMRQNGNVAYLSKMTDRTNVYFLTGATVSKILFDGTTATGVQYTYNGTTYNATATTNVVLSAGALNTPKVLQNSGIGDADLLNKLGIDIIVNNTEVGQNLMDHMASIFCIPLDEASVSTAAADPHKFPAPIVTNYDAYNQSQTQPEKQDIILYFTPSSSGFLQLCTYGFKYLDWICDTWYEYNKNRNMLMVISNFLHPESKGSVAIESTDVNAKPTVKLGLFNNKDDLEKFAVLMQRYVNSIINSTTLSNLGAEFADLGICTEYTAYSLDYFRCYVLAMSSTMWHYTGTAAMGKVVDASLNVLGTSKLKVVDASIIPYLTSGNPSSAVRAMAEKAAAIMIKENCNTRPFC